MAKVRTRRQLHKYREEQRKQAAIDAEPTRLRESGPQRERRRSMAAMLKGVDPKRFEVLAQDGQASNVWPAEFEGAVHGDFR